jgi:hypothetical protein
MPWDMMFRDPFSVMGSISGPYITDGAKPHGKD